MANRFFTGTNPDFGSRTRYSIFRFIVLFCAAVFIIRLGHLQLVKGSSYRLESETQAIKKDYVEPFRGNMFDRNGYLLVHNEPSFTVRITPYSFDTSRILLLSSIIGLDTTTIKSKIKATKTSIFEPVKILRDVDYQMVSTLSEYEDLLPGVDVAIESKRLYNFNGNMAHTLGYTREISQTQLDRKKYYRQGDIIGQTGLEQSYEDFLRGNVGIKYVAVNRHGQKVSSFENGKSDIPVENGFDLLLSIDHELQEKAEELLDKKRGAVVVIDPKNGEVLAIVSKPDYDPRAFSGKIPAQLYKSIESNPGVPLLNRSVMSAYPPGSTWKMLVALASLQEGLITDKTTYVCSGSFQYGNKSFACHSHGLVDIRHSLQYSCNVYYYNLGLKLGLERLTKYAKMFGFGSKTHIDLPSESSGLFPSSEWWSKKGGFTKGRLVNYGIGQGEINVTPLQMAVYISAIANEGILYQPHIVRGIFNNIDNKFQPIDYSGVVIPIEKQYFKIIKDGMYNVVNAPGGTAYATFINSKSYSTDVKVYGKTGTAQNPHGRDHSWFVCFAERGDSSIAMAVIVENAGFGSEAAAPISFDLIAKYFKTDIIKQSIIPKDSILADTNKKKTTTN